MAASFRRLMGDSRQMSRRSFLAIPGWVGFSVASAIALYQSLKFVYPNATYEDPPAFKADPPTTYAVGSTTVLIDKRVVINHDPNGFYAISLICTRSEEHTSELQSQSNLVCRLLLEKKKKKTHSLYRVNECTERCTHC